MEDNNKLILSRKENALKVFKNTVDFLNGMNAVVCMKKYSKYNTAADCLESKAATLIEIQEWYGSDCPPDFLSIQLATLNMFVNVSQHLSYPQIKEISFWIFDQWPNLNIAEITLVISRIKLGSYGKLYNNLSGEFILSCFGSYAKDRNTHLIKSELSKSDGYGSITSYETGFMEHIDKLPRVRHLLDMKVTEEERLKIEKEERDLCIRRAVYKHINEK